MNRTDLQNLTRLRVREANVLLSNKRYEGAFYLLGYALECALKACVAKQFVRHDFPDKKFVNDIYTHDLNKLLNLSGLTTEHKKECARNPNFEISWSIVRDWTEQSRYNTNVSRQQAQEFHAAVTSRKNGVLTWLRKFW